MNLKTIVKTRLVLEKNASAAQKSPSNTQEKMELELKGRVGSLEAALVKEKVMCI
jgi:hypothetical protein